MHVYSRTGTLWSYQQEIPRPAGLPKELVFGGFVAIDGDTLAVGAYSEFETPTGQVHLYQNSGDDFVWEAGFDANHNGICALDGDLLAIATEISPLTDDVVLYERLQGEWAWYGSVSGGAGFTRFITSIDLDGDALVVGDVLDGNDATGIWDSPPPGNSKELSGAVYVFTRSGDATVTNSWSMQAFIKASNAEAFDEFGRSIALDGDTLVVGAPGESSAGTGVNGGSQDDNSLENSGAVYIFK